MGNISELLDPDNPIWFNIYEISEEDICCTIGVDFPPYKLPIECDCEE